jgi:hypothetical protein
MPKSVIHAIQVLPTITRATKLSKSTLTLTILTLAVHARLAPRTVMLFIATQLCALRAALVGWPFPPNLRQAASSAMSASILTKRPMNAKIVLKASLHRILDPRFVVRVPLVDTALTQAQVNV